MPAMILSWFVTSGWKYLLGALILATIAGSYVYARREGVNAGIAQEHIKTLQVQNAYDTYAAKVAADTANANAVALKESEDQDATIASLQASLTASQAKATKDSAAFVSALQSAPKGTVQPLSATVKTYLASVKAENAN